METLNNTNNYNCMTITRTTTTSPILRNLVIIHSVRFSVVFVTLSNSFSSSEVLIEVDTQTITKKKNKNSKPCLCIFIKTIPLGNQQCLLTNISLSYKKRERKTKDGDMGILPNELTHPCSV